MKLNKLLDYNIIREFAIQNDLDFVAVFGSYYNGKPTDSSDVDLIIDSKNQINSEMILSMSRKLNKLLKKKVDLITPKLIISSLVCGYVWRLKQYHVIYGEQIVKD